MVSSAEEKLKKIHQKKEELREVELQKIRNEKENHNIKSSLKKRLPLQKNLSICYFAEEKENRRRRERRIQFKTEEARYPKQRKP